jgi:hypothetical protein
MAKGLQSILQSSLILHHSKLSGLSLSVTSMLQARMEPVRDSKPCLLLLDYGIINVEGVTLVLPSRLFMLNKYWRILALS